MMTIDRRTQEEKRDFIRMNADTEAEFSLVGSDEVHEAKCRNLSGAGMLIDTQKALNIGDKLTITIKTHGPNFDPLVADVEVIRVNHDEQQNLYRLGLSIQKILN